MLEGRGALNALRRMTVRDLGLSNALKVSETARAMTQRSKWQVFSMPSRLCGEARRYTWT